AYLVANDFRFRRMFQAIEDEPDVAMLVNDVGSVNNPDFEPLSSQLYFMLVLAMPEDSTGESILSNTPEGEGALAWKKLLNEYSPNEPGNIVGQFRKILGTVFPKDADIVTEIMKLDKEIARYEKASGETVSANVSRGILLGALSEEPDLQKHLFRNLRSLPTYADMRAEVVNALAAQRSVNDDAMDIGALKGGKSKGGKAKGGKDGKSKKGATGAGPSCAASSASTIPVGLRALTSSSEATSSTLAPKFVFGLEAIEAEERHVSIAAVSHKPKDAIMIDSGAQISAMPSQMVYDAGYMIQRSKIHELHAIDGSKVPHHGRTDVKIRRGDAVLQLGMEVADIEHPVLSTDAITRRGQSVLHSPMGDWIVDAPMLPPDGAEVIKLKKERSACYLEFDELLKDGQNAEQSKVMAALRPQESEESVGILAAARKTLAPSTVPTSSSAALPRALGPDPSENVTLKAKELTRPGQPTAQERRAHAAHHLPFRPWCPECVMGRGRERPHPKQQDSPELDADQVPIVEMDFFFAATDDIAKKYPMLHGFVVKLVEAKRIPRDERRTMIPVLNIVDGRSNAMGTLMTNKTVGQYKTLYVAKLIDSTFRFALEKRLEVAIDADHPILPFVTNAIGWYITRFQPREHGGSSYKFLFGKEYDGEVAEIGEQVRYRIAGRVASGQGKFEARFAKGVWAGKSAFDDQHLVVDLQRGLLKVRTVRRMPEEFRWSEDLLRQISVTPWDPTPARAKEIARPKGLYITERMIDRHGPTSECLKCSTGRGQLSDACRQRFEHIVQEELERRLKTEGASPATPAPPGVAPGTPVPESAPGPSQRSQPEDRAPGAPRPGAQVQEATADQPPRSSVGNIPDTPMDTKDDATRKHQVEAAETEDQGGKRQRIELLGVRPEVTVIAGLSVCELAVCEADDSEEYDPVWDPIPMPESRCDGRCPSHGGRCALRADHRGGCACRLCLIHAARAVEAPSAVVAGLYSMWADGLDDEVETPQMVHYDYCSGEPLDEELYQEGRRDELEAMREYGVYSEIPISQCQPGGKHVRGFPIAHMKGDRVRWRFVATEVNDKHREDNHQGTPPLMVIRLIISLAASKSDADGVHRRLLRVWDVRKAFFNADLDELVYVHPGWELCPKGFCWVLHKAMNGTRKASQLWGETSKAAIDDAGGKPLKGTAGTYHFENLVGDGMDATMCCHGDDFLAEGHRDTLDAIGNFLEANFEVTESESIGPGYPGELNNLKRIVGYTSELPETRMPGFYWSADPKHVEELIRWGHKSGSKAAPTPGTKATGAGMRNALDPLPVAEAKSTSSAAGLSLYVSSDRPDAMFSSKTIMQHVSKPNVLMNARLHRLCRHYEGAPRLLWCYELQDLPEVLRVDADADWASTTSLFRTSTSGGVVRFGGHTVEAFAVCQATQALSSGESEFYAIGSGAARGLQAKHFLGEVGVTVRLVVASDSAAGRGICQRHGVGKVRHLELRYLWLQDRVRLRQLELIKEATTEMVADILTKYVESETLYKHMATMNLRLVPLGAVVVSALLPTARGQETEAGAKGAPWLLIVMALSIALLSFLVGCCAGARACSTAVCYERPETLIDDSAAPEHTASDGDARVQLVLSRLTVPDLRAMARANKIGLGVGYVRKQRLIEMIISAGASPTVEQAERLESVRAVLSKAGLSCSVEPRLLLTKQVLESHLVLLETACTPLRKISD
ncbi:unnamed protein product, partial [Prorocentrum cordatum]